MKKNFFNGDFISPGKTFVSFASLGWFKDSLDFGPEVVECFWRRVIECVRVDQIAERVAEHASIHLQFKERLVLDVFEREGFSLVGSSIGFLEEGVSHVVHGGTRDEPAAPAVFERGGLVCEMGAGFENRLAFDIRVNGAEQVAWDVAGEGSAVAA